MERGQNKVSSLVWGAFVSALEERSYVSSCPIFDDQMQMENVLSFPSAFISMICGQILSPSGQFRSLLAQFAPVNPFPSSLGCGFAALRSLSSLAAKFLFNIRCSKFNSKFDVRVKS